MGKKKDELYPLYIELVKLQKDVISNKHKVVIVLEGRDTAGKDGMIKTLTRYMSPRETRVVALGKPSEKDLKSWYFQRFTPHLPSEGEIVFFNRSWYNRAGVERVMGFCSDSEYKSFFTEVELFEQMLVSSGFTVIKYYLDISKKEQKKRLEDRLKNPLKQWKISPVDLDAQKLWKDYTVARDEMLSKTNFKFCPWYVVNAEDKATARISVMHHLLNSVDYKDCKLPSSPKPAQILKAFSGGNTVLYK